MNEFLISIWSKTCTRGERFTVLYHGQLWYVEAVDIKQRTLLINNMPENLLNGNNKVIPVSHVVQDPLRVALNNYVLTCLLRNGYDDVVKVLEEIDTL